MKIVAAVKRDYYEVLGLPREADAEAIKRAFHSLARDWHPDITNHPEAESRFRELAEAYSVLSKRDTRLLYDRYGYRGRGNQGFNEALWDARSEGARGGDVHVPLQLRSFEATEGTRRLLRYEAKARCEECAGRGSLGLADPDCQVCRGSGRKRTLSDLDVASLLHIEVCPACVGEVCAHCAGKGTVADQRRIRLIVPPGVEDGADLRAAGEGDDAGPGSVPGDLLVRVTVLPPPRDPRIVRSVALVLLIVAVATLALYVTR